MRDSPPTDPPIVLLDFDAWANDQLFDACQPLSNEDLDRSFEMGLGTLRKTMTHMLGAMRGWTDVLIEADPPRPRLEHDPDRSVDDLRKLHETISPAFRLACFDGSHGDVLTPDRNGKTHKFSRGGIMMHVMTHSMHHRAQCLNMLRHLGREQPQSSVMHWMMAHPPQ